MGWRAKESNIKAIIKVAITKSLVYNMPAKDEKVYTGMSTSFIESLAARRRFGMRPGLDAIRRLCGSLGNPQASFRAVHVAGTNGKGAVCALLDAALREGRRKKEEGKGKREEGRGAKGRLLVGRYTSPHLVKLNERFFIEGRPISDADLERFAEMVQASPAADDVTFFEALTAVAFLAFAEARVDHGILECGLGGRLDATNICDSELCVITRIGLDHCDWLGGTVDKIAAEKAGIVKPGVPVVLGRNDSSVRAVVESRAKAVGAPFFYAPDVVDEREMPEDLPLRGTFNRENAVTALAALRVLDGLCRGVMPSDLQKAWSGVAWPGRYQRVGEFIVDGAHNPPAADALAAALSGDFPGGRLPLVAGFCGDKDVESVLRALAPHVSRGFAVRTTNPRSLSADATAGAMRGAGIPAEACPSLAEALARSRESGATAPEPTLVCGSLFLAGEALVALGAYPWGDAAVADPSETLRPNMV